MLLARVVLCVSLACAVLLASRPLFAQTETVEELLREGIELRRAGKDAQALDVLNEAAALEPTSIRVKVQLATVHQALGHWLQAESYLSEALAAGSDPYIQRYQAVLERAYAAVSRRVGRLELVGGLVGAVVLLNGRELGTLPMTAPARVVAGAYQMQVHLAGYYPLSRPIEVLGGKLVREQVELVPIVTTEPTPVVGAVLAPGTTGDAFVAAPVELDRRPWAPRWVPWTLGGLSLAAAGGAVALGLERERTAERFNGPGCISASASREELCGTQRERGRRAGMWAWISGAGAAGLGLGAVLTAVMQSSVESQPETVPTLSLARCNVGARGVWCSGSF